MDIEPVDVEALQIAFYHNRANRVDIIKHMRANGFPWAMISERVGVGISSCQRTLKKHLDEKAAWEEWRAKRRAFRAPWE